MKDVKYSGCFTCVAPCRRKMLLLATQDRYAPKTIQGFGLKKGKDFCS